MTASHCHSYCQLSPSLFLCWKLLFQFVCVIRENMFFCPFTKKGRLPRSTLHFCHLSRIAALTMLLLLRPWWTSNQVLTSLRWLNFFEKPTSSFEQKEASISLDFFWWKKVSYLFKISKSTLSQIFFLFSIFTLKPNFIISLKETWIGEKKKFRAHFLFPIKVIQLWQQRFSPRRLEDKA